MAPEWIQLWATRTNVDLAGGVDLNKIEANFKNGVLEIKLPAAEKLLHKIEVKRLDLGA